MDENLHAMELLIKCLREINERKAQGVPQTEHIGIITEAAAARRGDSFVQVFNKRFLNCWNSWKNKKWTASPAFQVFDRLESRHKRTRILREIYEENRSMRDWQSALQRKASQKKAPQRQAWRLQPWFPIIAVIIALAGFGLPVIMRQEREAPPVVNAGMAAAATVLTAVQPVSAAASVSVNNADEIKSLEVRGDIPLGQMFNLGIRRIVVDAGHGGSNPGTIGGGGTLEKDITLSVALKLRDKLIRLGVADVLMTRTEDVTVSLQERVDYAKEAKADMFISIHVNSLPNSHRNVVETFYFGPTEDSRTLQLADIENTGSEYGLSDFMEIVERMGKTMKLQESKMLADVVQNSLYHAAKELDPNAIDTGVKRAPFVVLMGLDVPSVLVEIACMSNAKSEKDLSLAENQERIAAALAAGIMSYQNRE
jgi:N-acetylmuramoyl-L-alanine amidase